MGVSTVSNRPRCPFLLHLGLKRAAEREYHRGRFAYGRHGVEGRTLAVGSRVVGIVGVESEVCSGEGGGVVLRLGITQIVGHRHVEPARACKLQPLAPEKKHIALYVRADYRYFFGRKQRLERFKKAARCVRDAGRCT